MRGDVYAFRVTQYRGEDRRASSTRNPVAGDWENREGYELVLQDLHFSNSILGVLEAMLGCVR